MAKLRSFSCKRLSLATLVWYLCLPLTLCLRSASPSIAQVCHFVSGNNSATIDEMTKREFDAENNMILHFGNEQIHSIPPKSQADCNDGNYRNVPTILTSPPKNSPPKKDSKTDA